MTKKGFIYALLTFCVSVLFQSANSRDVKSLALEIPINAQISTETVISQSDAKFALTRPTNNINIPRTVSQQAKRPFSTGNSANSLLKDGKVLNIGSTASYIINLYRFPSGLKESTHRFISLRKIVI